MFFGLHSGQRLILFHRNYKWRLRLLVSGFHNHVSILHYQYCISQLEKNQWLSLEEVLKSSNFNLNTNSIKKMKTYRIGMHCRRDQ